VIHAARNFVAIRPATYESEKEAAYLKSLMGPTRSGDLENSTFGILASDGKTPLSRIHRGPNHVFGTAPKMLEAMDKIAKAHPPLPESDQGNRIPPSIGSMRLALNIASCENQPLIVVGPGAPPEYEKELTRIFFASNQKGRFVMARASAEEIAQLEGADSAKGAQVMVVQTNPFGTRGKILAKANPADGIKGLESATLEGAKAFVPAAKGLPGDSTYRTHLQTGFGEGIFWDTKIPVTDLGEAQARKRNPNAKKNPQ